MSSKKLVKKQQNFEESEIDSRINEVELLDKLRQVNESIAQVSQLGFLTSIDDLNKNLSKETRTSQPQNDINDLRIGEIGIQECAYCNLCGVEVPLTSLRRHIDEECGQKKIRCKVPGCGAVFPRYMERQHKKRDCVVVVKNEELLRRRVERKRLEKKLKEEEEEEERMMSIQMRVPSPPPSPTHITTSSLPLSPTKEGIGSDSDDWSEEEEEEERMEEDIQEEQEEKEPPPLLSCPNKLLGCRVKMPMSQITAHLMKKCEVERRKGGMVRRSNRRREVVECPHCGYKGRIMDMQSHNLNHCPHRKLPCRNWEFGCEAMIRERDRAVHESVDQLLKPRPCLSFDGGRCGVHLNEEDLQPPWTAEFYIFRWGPLQQGKLLIKRALKRYFEFGVLVEEEKRLCFEMKELEVRVGEVALDVSKATAHERETKKQARKDKRKSKRKKRGDIEDEGEEKEGGGEIEDPVALATQAKNDAIALQMTVTQQMVDSVDKTEQAAVDSSVKAFHTRNVLLAAYRCIQEARGQGDEIANEVKESEEDEEENEINNEVQLEIHESTEEHNSDEEKEEINEEDEVPVEEILDDEMIDDEMMEDEMEDSNPYEEISWKECVEIVESLYLTFDGEIKELEKFRKEMGLGGKEHEKESSLDKKQDEDQEEEIKKKKKKKKKGKGARSLSIPDRAKAVHNGWEGHDVLASSSTTRIVLDLGDEKESFGICQFGKPTVALEVPIPRQKWLHFVLLCTEKKLTLFVNGKVAGSKVVYGGVPFPMEWMGSLEEAMLGCLSEVRIWNVDRSPREIREYASKLLDEVKMKEEDGLNGYWSFEEGEGRFVFDLSEQRYRIPIVGSGVRWKGAEPLTSQMPISPSFREKQVCQVELRRARLAMKGRMLFQEEECTGCGEMVRRRDMRFHKTFQCSSRQSVCRFWGCNQVFKESERMDHEQKECTILWRRNHLAEEAESKHVLVECELCADQVQVGHLNSHMEDECDYRTVSCDLPLCHETVVASRLDFHRKYSCRNPAMLHKRQLVWRARKLRPTVRPWMTEELEEFEKTHFREEDKEK